MFRLVVVLLLLVPTAQACSFSREPPGPGVFYVWDMQGEPQAVAVQQRGLGATCELSNLHAVDADTFVWLEGDTLHVLESDAHGRIAWTGDSPQDLALSGGDILVRENTGSGQERVHKVWHAADSGAKTLLYSTTTFGRLHGPYYVTQQDGVGIVDVRTGDTVAEPQTARQRGFDGQEPHFIGTDGRFLVYESTRPQGHQIHIHDLHTGGWSQTALEGHGIWMQVADGRFYSAREENLTIVDLASGATSRALVPDIALLGAGEGRVVLGAYSAASVSGSWQAAVAGEQAPAQLWWLAAVLGLAWRRRAGGG